MVSLFSDMYGVRRLLDFDRTLPFAVSLFLKLRSYIGPLMYYLAALYASRMLSHTLLSSVLLLARLSFGYKQPFEYLEVLEGLGAALVPKFLFVIFYLIMDPLSIDTQIQRRS